MKKSWCQLLTAEKLPEDHYAVFKAITKFSKVDKNEVYELMGLPKNNAKHTKKPESKFVLSKILEIKLGRAI
ncbi:hypothetical protein [Klebsiella michiganensis]|uniref:hypothetical protein n=1 Tax=Klebsiella michiganensis TaxID=1134687 RepID=UPI001D0D1B08|nr:hypothetical protein [Klebsiella michiganensis]